MNVFTAKTVDKNDFIETAYKNIGNGYLTKQVPGGAKWDAEKNCMFETLIAFVPKYIPQPNLISRNKIPQWLAGYENLHIPKRDKNYGSKAKNQGGNQGDVFTSLSHL